MVAFATDSLCWHCLLFLHEQRRKPPWKDFTRRLIWAKVKTLWRKQTCFAKGPRKLKWIEVYNIVLLCQNLGVYGENPRNCGQRSSSLHQGFAHSNLNHWLILVYFFHICTASNSDDFEPRGFLLKPTKITTFPAKVLRKMIMPGYVREAKMMVAKVPRKVLRKRYMSIMKWSLCFHHCSNTPSALPSLFRRDHWRASSMPMLRKRYKSLESVERIQRAIVALSRLGFNF